MGRTPKVEFANLICKFGEKNMLDFLEEIVLPAFFDKNIERGYGNTKYFFRNQKIIEKQIGDSTDVLLVGRLIKDTILSSEQRYDRTMGLVKDEKHIQSSPSAIFCLILNNHRLLYLHETRFSPSLIEYKSVFKKFINERRKLLIEKIYNEKKDTEEKITKKELFKKIPPGMADLIPLSTEADLKEFIRSYNLLKTVEIIVKDTNNEMDLSGMLNQIRSSKNDLQAKTTVLKHHNSKGLSKEHASQQLDSIVKQGNAEVKLTGEDDHGGTIRGNNQDFKLSAQISEEPISVRHAVDQMYDVYSDLTGKQTINIPDRDQKVDRKLRLVVNNKDK